MTRELIRDRLTNQQFTYALLDERVPRVRPISSDESLARLTER